ncbi:phage holin family protein [Prevotellamassilia timonensis]|uniref:phage holin family protein n=1 Tax=Prevotellamassilia timonensis TaxID=1852370 RepID=UPI001F1D20FD|nr:phage holin family protein [Prevotellamassilia timonensis]
MMKLYKLFILTLLSVIITSCSQDKARFTPYTPNYYEVKGSAKSIIEREYSNKSKLIYTKQCDFDKSGRLVSFKHIVDKDTVTRFMHYGDNGRIENIQWNEITKYTPEFNEFGDLIKETYITGENNGFKSGFIQEWGYDLNGNIINEKTCYIESDCSSVEYLYENNKLKQVKEYNLGEEIHYDCDTLGLVVSKKVYDEAANKITSQSTYKYKLDNNGNWVEKIERENRRLKSTVKREILYYSEAELTASNTAEQTSVSTKSYINIAFVDNYINDVLSRSVNQADSPSRVLFIILIVCTIIVTARSWYMASDFVFHNFTGHIQNNGMKRLWMYNHEPYTKAGTLLLIALAAFVASIILILLVGVVIWGLLWGVKLIFGAIIIIGWICLVGGVLALFGKEPVGCLPLIIGILIVRYQDTIKEVGEDLVTWGFEFMQSVNMFSWGLGIFKNYWDVILVIFFTPMVLFLAFAVFVISLNMLLNGFEFIVTRIYSIRRPCPVCGSTATPDYIVGGKPHPVKLHPGVYGVFTHKSPVTGKSIPTMLLNGRGKVTRKCKKCNSFINADTDNTIGTEIHIGIVGHRSSGKSYLLYSGLYSLMSSYPERFSQIDADNDTRIENKKKRIDARDGIQTDVANKYRAIQLILKSKLRPVPYHLFFYDVAGEKFNASSSSHKTAMDFYRNVQSIVFIVDPSMLDISGTPASAKFVDWHKRNANAEKYRIDGSFAVLKDILETVGRKSNKIDFNFVCTKTDMGYLPELGYSKTPGENEIERFISTELGLSNLINSARAGFKNVHFYTVSAIESDKSRLKNLFITLLEQRKVTL